MLNCSREQDYLRQVETLRKSLMNRGYPEHVLCSPHYDQHWRLRKLNDILHRQHSLKQNNAANKDLLVFKLPYVPWWRKFGVKKEYKRLVKQLILFCGDDAFAARLRMLVVHTVGNNSFKDTFALNFVD